jgi:ribonuclease T1
VIRLFLGLLLAGVLGLAQAQEIARNDLPPEAREITFNNYEKRLPLQPRGHYREYTVPTPGVSHRGARRIVCGGEPRRPDACWYTADHYRSFRKIRP